MRETILKLPRPGASGKRPMAPGGCFTHRRRLFTESGCTGFRPHHAYIDGYGLMVSGVACSETRVIHKEEGI